MSNYADPEYLGLMRDVLERGTEVPTRAFLASLNRPARAKSIFGAQLRVPLDPFPLLTTKRVFMRGVEAELRWFLNGDTNVKTLQDQNVRIWDAWASADGDLGPVYGAMWRAWPGPDGTTVDQVAKLIEGIRQEVQSPGSSVGRRLILNAWHASFIDQMRLPPCHLLAQWSVRPGKRLSCMMTMRSADLFLGVPFNIASYAALTYLLASVTGTTPGDLVVSFGDVHVYENHYESAKTQLAREIRSSPTLRVTTTVTADLRDLPAGVLRLEDYDPAPPLPGEVAV